MDESRRLFFSARINMFRLLTREEDGESHPFSPEIYQSFKNQLTSFSLGQGSYGYHIPVQLLSEMGLDVEAWKTVAPAGAGKSGDTLRLSDHYHVCEMDNVLDHLIQGNETAISALKDAVRIVDKNTQRRA